VDVAIGSKVDVGCGTTVGVEAAAAPPHAVIKSTLNRRIKGVLCMFAPRDLNGGIIGAEKYLYTLPARGIYGILLR